MKVLVLVQDYPSDDKPYAMSYVHSRNIEYIKAGHNVKVVSFSTNTEYKYECVKVYRYSRVLVEEADIIVSHAPNIKNSFKRLRKIKNKKICLVFHGHEVLRKYGDYPVPYDWAKDSFFKKNIIKTYDSIKIKLVNKLISNLSLKNNLGLIFVSDWMQEQFINNVKLNPIDLGLTQVIANSSNNIFFLKSYDLNEKEVLADFITIRPLDESKYAIDLVVDLAKNNPKNSFHIYGKGKYFEYNEKPKNIKVINEFIHQKDMPDLFNKYRVALMPTRYDAQGVMMCEMATFGMPVITTNFEVCIEMLSSFSNVIFLKENEFRTTLVSDLTLHNLAAINNKFHPKYLVEKELKLLAKL